MERTRPESAVRSHRAGRALLVVVAGAGISWSLAAVDGLSEFYQLDRISESILSGEMVPPRSLGPLLARFDSSLSVGCERNMIPRAVIRLYAAVSARDSAASDASLLLNSAERQLKETLVCTPYQPYLWYGLFWVRMMQGERPQNYIPLLEQSYALGPRELWISIYRNSDALPLFSQLDVRTRALVRAEYLNLAKEQTDVAARNFKSSDDSTRSYLLKWISDLSIEQRRNFAAALDRTDVVANVPGVEYREGHVVWGRK